MVLTIRTDNPDAEIGLFALDGSQINYYKWRADRRLAKELLAAIRDHLAQQQAGWGDISGVVAYQGPGSFTGLRIGLTVANTIAYGQNVPIVAQQGENWVHDGIDRLAKGQNDTLALPHYGAEANITMPKK